ncbi:sulfite reductase subunit alpha [Pseudoduganella namucuonensis]|uniref:NADPH--hemoprotein reductase n=1 Tax=Pseudoduganella namucuonensis TaxID=1035707 RepID=A0A1I7IU10_9BURK|nr:sulfite reductase subunit alpha [Pseudoduganella namucuonensis]SFU76410.1 sulfite reductase (NADPH) flavoprotein alpha-component [Pseudoduganella namucuonensis]
MILTNDSTRLLLTAACFLGYGLVCLAPWLRLRRKRLAAGLVGEAAARAPGWIVAHASQTGNAEALAGQTLETLRLAGIPARLCELSELSGADLQAAERVLFLVSTYGEGDAPDAAATFCSRLMTRALPLPKLHYAVLALGDSSYGQYCGFGRALDGWLREQGASSLFERIEVDRGAEPAIAAWRQQLSHLAGTSDAPDWSAPDFGAWRLAERRQLNPGSPGAPIFHLELEPEEGALPDWQSGDLAQVAAPGDPSRPREYSVASIPADGRVALLVRLHLRADGGAGLASGWLCREAAVGATVRLRLRQHRRFRLEANAGRPLILIGNGSGIAGLRGHLRARALAGQGRNWLLFGERNAAHDYHYAAEWDALRGGGMLAGLDLAWSRDGGAARYVQDLLPPRADALRAWLDDGAAIYVCGSLDGMAAGVDRALEGILGRAYLDRLIAENRYRRDVY